MKFNKKKLIPIIIAIFVAFLARIAVTNNQTSISTQNEIVSKQINENIVWNKLNGPTMGTSFNISYSSDPQNKLQEVSNIESQVIKLLEDFNKEFSTYDKTSVISQFNQLDQVDVKFPISKDYVTIIKKSNEINQLTSGYFDITVYPLVKAWGFGPGKPNANLTQEQIDEIKKNIGNDQFVLGNDDEQYYLVKKNQNITHDLSAIAKGYAVDLVAQLLDNAGIDNYIVEIGGEIKTRGINEQGTEWILAIEEPNFDGTFDINSKIQIGDKAIATSGNYRNFRFVGGKRISHEINPFTGRPIEHSTASVSVIADDCMTADALATGLYVMGTEKALELAEVNNLAVFIIDFIDGKFVVHKSSAFDKVVKLLP